MSLRKSISLKANLPSSSNLPLSIAAYVLGARKGRFNEVDGRRIVRDFPGHSIALKMLGVFILWFG